MFRLQSTPNDDLAALDLRRKTVLDGILDDWLQHHAGNNHIKGLRVEVLHDLQLFRTKTGDFDVEIVVDELHLLPQQDKCVMFPEQRTQYVGELHNQVSRLLWANTHERGD